MAAYEDTKAFEKQLIEAAEITLDPLAAPQLRNNAFEFIEQFKKDSSICADVGLILFKKNNSPIVRHLGLQLLEHCIKFRWNTMETLKQEGLKCTCLELIANGTKPVLEEQLHIKESLARLVVEVIKREWPQKWESLLQDLTMICNMGDTQTELTLMVFLRLAEDIISMDSHLQQHRKREITQALHLHMESLFTFFIETLRTSIANMFEKKKDTSILMQSQAVVHQRVAEQTLQTLQGFLEWVKFNILFTQDCILLQMLCVLVHGEELNIPACECLLIIVSRKGKLDQMAEYARLFSEDATQFMQTAAKKACNAEYSEKQYLFLKRLCQVLTTLGSVQLMKIWGKETPQAKPATFRQYLETIQMFSMHSSLALTHLTNNLWLVILRHDIIGTDKDVKLVMPLLLQMAKTNILKVGDPNTCDSCDNVFNMEDFSSSKEFESVFTQVRSQVMDIVKIITLQFPVETFFIAADWLISNIEKTKSGLETVSAEEIQHLRIQFDGVCCYMTAVMAKLFLVDNIQELLNTELTFRGNPIKVIDLARNCIQSLLMVDISVFNDPSSLTDVADIFQSLLNFLTYTQDLILDVLKKIFSLITFNTTGDPKGPWSVNVLHTRRRACAALLKMCSSYGNLLVTMFDELKQYVMSLFDGELVTVQDRTTLTEALVIASNFLQDSSVQDEFITGLLAPCRELLINNRNSISVEWLIPFLGMDVDPHGDLKSNEISKNRFKLMLVLTTILAVVRRYKLQKSTQSNGSSGRRSIGLMPDGASSHVDCSPCSSHVLSLLPSLLILTQAVNKLHGSARSTLFPAYIASLAMHDSEKTAIFALQNSSDGERANESSNPIIRTKRFIFHLIESCYSTMGLLGDMVGGELYSQPGLAQVINEQVINTLHHLPNYRLRIVIRHFIKHFIINCPPPYYEAALVPVLSSFFNFMLQHLENEWQKVRLRRTDSVAVSEDEQDACSQEVIEDQFVYLITRDYMEIFSLACTLKKDKKLPQTEEATEQMRDEEEQEIDSTKKKEDSDAKLGPLGEILINTASVNMQLLSTVFATMTWLDSNACTKASQLCIPFIKRALAMAQSMGTMISTAVIEELYLQILKGIQIHGELGKSVLIRLGHVLYELLRQQYPTLKQVVLQTTGCSVTDMEAFEDICYGTKARSEKSKRDQFKKLVDNIIGKSLGELFKNEIKIKDLPAIKLPEKARQEEQEGSLGLADLFDPNKATEFI